MNFSIYLGIKTAKNFIRICLLILVIILSNSCNTNNLKGDKIVLIEGDVESLPTQKIYLADAYNWEKLLDSTECKKGKFSLNIPMSRYGEPFEVSLQFKNKNGQFETLFFDTKNTKTPNGKPHIVGSFMLEEGITKINGRYTGFTPPPKLHVSKLNILPGKQTKALFRLKFSNLISNDYSTTLKNTRKEINEFPFSFYLIDNLYENRSHYNNDDLIEMLSQFTGSIQSSKKAKLLTNYLSIRKQKHGMIKQLSLFNDKGERTKVISEKVKINMLVFWASWCGPCRMEIPELKSIYSRFKKNPSFHIVSVSIDEDKNGWQKALDYERMEWEQLIASKDVKEKVHNLFDITSIPLVIFFDNNGKEIKRFIGYSNDQFKEYIKVINEYSYQ